MLNKIVDFFWGIAGLKAFIAALLIYLAFAGLVMSPGAAKIQQLSGKKIEILDLQFTYTPAKARAIIADYGDAARNYAANFEMIADTLYPVVYTFLFAIMISWVFKSLSAYGVRVKYVLLLPYCVMFADYGENIGIIQMLKTFPNFSDFHVVISSFFTSLKWSLLVVETVIIGGSVWLFIFYRMTRGKAVSK